MITIRHFCCRRSPFVVRSAFTVQYWRFSSKQTFQMVRGRDHTTLLFAKIREATRRGVCALKLKQSWHRQDFTWILTKANFCVLLSVRCFQNKSKTNKPKINVIDTLCKMLSTMHRFTVNVYVERLLYQNELASDDTMYYKINFINSIHATVPQHESRWGFS